MEILLWWSNRIFSYIIYTSDNLLPFRSTFFLGDKCSDNLYIHQSTQNQRIRIGRSEVERSQKVVRKKVLIRMGAQRTTNEEMTREQSRLSSIRSGFLLLLLYLFIYWLHIHVTCTASESLDFLNGSTVYIYQNMFFWIRKADFFGLNCTKCSGCIKSDCH